LLGGILDRDGDGKMLDDVGSMLFKAWVARKFGGGSGGLMSVLFGR